MALGNLTKQLAAQALGNSLENVLDKPPAPSKPESLGATILGQIQAMQKALKEDQELVVGLNAGLEQLRVLEIYVPSWQVFVLTGIDLNQNITRIVSPVDSIQLVCKVVKVQPPAKPTRIVFLTPKPKSE
ncbi:MAG: hypothetical protein ACR2NN_27275 [Bryobacteraceae bacterium]